MKRKHKMNKTIIKLENIRMTNFKNIVKSEISFSGKR